MDKHVYEREIVQMAASLTPTEREKFISLLQQESQNPVELFGWNMWLGFFGVDRFLVGDIGLGILKLITLGGLGIWQVVDCFLIGNRTRKNNIEKARYIYDSIQARA